MVTPTVQRPSFIAAALLVLVGFSRIVFAADVPSQTLAAQQVVHLLDYVGADYGGAVAGGQVSRERERARRTDRGLGRGGSASPKIEARIRCFRAQGRRDGGQRLVEATVLKPKWAPLPRVQPIRSVAFFDLVQAPRQAPLRDRGKQLYEQHCAACHGIDGKADTQRAQQYSPRPANFHLPEVARALSPLRVSRAVRFGVPSTAMVPFDFSSEEERWDIAFYVSELDYAAAPVRRAESRMFGLAELSAESDDELRADLRERRSRPENHAESALSDLRLRAPYDAVTLNPMGASAMMLRARAGLRKVGSFLVRGDREAARTSLSAVYLDNVEPIQAPLRAADPALVRDIEMAFKEVRADIENGAPPEATTKKLESGDHSNGTRRKHPRKRGAPLLHEHRFMSAGIALREGVEAALLIAALLAVVAKSGIPERKRWVHAGWLTAAMAAAITCCSSSDCRDVWAGGAKRWKAWRLCSRRWCSFM